MDVELRDNVRGFSQVLGWAVLEVTFESSKLAYSISGDIDTHFPMTMKNSLLLDINKRLPDCALATAGLNATLS